MLKYFYKNFYNNHQSIISELFFGVEHCILKYCECNKTEHFYNYYPLLIFPFEEVRNSKYVLNNNNNQYNTFNDRTINILDCFEYYQKMVRIKQENMDFPICEKHKKYAVQILLHSLPEIFFIYLDIGKVSYYINLKYDEIIDLNNYTKYGGVYELIGIISYFISRYRHFIALCKSPIHNRWYSYNDNRVDSIESLERNAPNGPYILFYQRIK